MTYWDGNHMNGTWGIVAMLSMMAFWLLLAVTVIWFLRSGSRSTPATDSATEILARRLARGEIDSEEYKTRLSALSSP